MMYFGFEHISIAYQKKQVLSDLTFEVPKGKIVTLIGQNGCGKSSLLKTVSRSVVPKSGQVLYNGQKLSTYPPKFLAQKIAYLAQVHASPPDIDVRTLVSYGRYPYSRMGRRLTANDQAVIDRAIQMTGLSELQHQQVSTLSGGERQRAWIAMTMAQEPEILILDEPTTYLDIGYQIELLELVEKLNRSLHITILMVLHDLNLAARYSDYLYVIKDGELFAKGTPCEILTRQTLLDVFSIDTAVLQDSLHQCPYFIPHKSIKEKGEFI